MKIRKKAIILSSLWALATANLFGVVRINFTGTFGQFDGTSPAPYNDVYENSGLSENLLNEFGQETSVGVSFETSGTNGNLVLQTITGGFHISDPNIPNAITNFAVGRYDPSGSRDFELDDPARSFTFELFGFSPFEEVELSMINALNELKLIDSEVTHFHEYTVVGETQIVSDSISGLTAPRTSAINYSTIVNASAEGEIYLTVKQLGTFERPYLMGLIIESKSATDVFTRSVEVPEPSSYALILGLFSFVLLSIRRSSSSKKLK